jgi:hypothetical protein
VRIFSHNTTDIGFGQVLDNKPAVAGHYGFSSHCNWLLIWFNCGFSSSKLAFLKSPKFILKIYSLFAPTFGARPWLAKYGWKEAWEWSETE